MPQHQLLHKRWVCGMQGFGCRFLFQSLFNAQEKRQQVQ